MNSQNSIEQQNSQDKHIQQNAQVDSADATLTPTQKRSKVDRSVFEMPTDPVFFGGRGWSPGSSAAKSRFMEMMLEENKEKQQFAKLKKEDAENVTRKAGGFSDATTVLILGWEQIKSKKMCEQCLTAGFTTCHHS